MSAKRYVLDSFALLAYLQDEPGAQLVQDVLADESAKVFLCTVNLGEVYYITYRELILQAARIKASFAISYADAFVAALAERRQSTIVTGDPEFKQLAHLSIKWLPSPY